MDKGPALAVANARADGGGGPGGDVSAVGFVCIVELRWGEGFRCRIVDLSCLDRGEGFGFRPCDADFCRGEIVSPAYDGNECFAYAVVVLFIHPIVGRC